MKPNKNLRTMNPGNEFVIAVGMHRMTNNPNDIIYGGFLPIAGISERGENSKGPIPYPKTYKDRPREAICGVV